MALIRIAPLLAATLALSACATQSVKVRELDARAFAPWSDAAPAYRLGAGDKVRIEYLMTPEMNQDAVVEPDGQLGLRVGHRVNAQNLTLAQLSQVVERVSYPRLRNPIVTATVVEPRAARIIVGGAVQRPGVYPLPARATTFEALMLAGGFQPSSKISQVVVIRPQPGGPPMMRTVDIRYAAGAARSEAIALAPEDIVFVPRLRAAEVKQWLDEVLPFSRGLSFGSTQVAQ